MDDLLRDFLTETGEHLDTVDAELVRFEKEPDDRDILRTIFRLVHTIKGTCGFLGLPRLEALSHAAETLMGRLRDGQPVTSEAVTLILATVDRLKVILAGLESSSQEPPGQDGDLIGALESAALAEPARPEPAVVRHEAAAAAAERPLRPGEVSFDELERAFREAPGPAELPGPAAGATGARTAGEGDGTRAAGSGDGASRRVQTIRVGVDTLEHLMTMVSELVLTRNQLLDLARKTGEAGGFKIPLQRLSHVTAELQDGIMRTRMQPIGSAWAKLPRVVRDLAPELGKSIDLVMNGAETELDRQVLEIIRDPLTHMVRNSADHGIERPEARLAAGKPARGTIRLKAFHEGGTITIEVSDDGRGLDFGAIWRRAAALGLASEAELARMGDEQVARFIFHPGFSTSRAVSAVSGRGVGMDVVKTNVELIGGVVDIASEPGRGTVFTIKIPLTLAIVAALIVSVGGQRFALPQVAVVELVRTQPGGDHPLEWIEAAPVLRLRDELLPVVDVAGLLSPGERRTGVEDGYVVVAAVGRQRFGILVQAVLETEEIVVKPLSALLRSVPYFSGNTILGDGTVVLILDPNGIARRVGSETAQALSDLAAQTGPAPVQAERFTLLVFRAGDGAFKAVPLSLVTRLEEIDAATIERAGGRAVVQYRGRLMPLICPDGPGAIRREGRQPVVVFAEGERAAGLCVDEIVDVVDSSLDVEPAPDRPDLVGSAIVRGRATEIVDVAGLLPWLGRRGADPDAERRGRPLVVHVDDNPFFRDMLAPVLRAAGYRVRSAANAGEALRALAEAGAAALVTDLGLPGRSGLDLVEEVRRDPRHRDVTAIVLSSEAGEQDICRARRLGVFDVVSKFDRPGLLAALAEADGERAAA